MDISVDDEVDSVTPGLKLKIKIADNSPEKPYVTFSVKDLIFLCKMTTFGRMWMLHLSRLSAGSSILYWLDYYDPKWGGGELFDLKPVCQCWFLWPLHSSLLHTPFNSIPLLLTQLVPSSIPITQLSSKFFVHPSLSMHFMKLNHVFSLPLDHPIQSIYLTPTLHSDILIGLSKSYIIYIF